MDLAITAPQTEKVEYIQHILTQKPQYRECLFSRGYFITDDDTIDVTAHPFYGLWKEERIQQYRIFVHKDQEYCIYADEGIVFLIIGHAYNPFNGEIAETKLLEQAAKAYRTGRSALVETINEWPGIFAGFFVDEHILAVQDCAGIKALYYGMPGGHMCILSHPQAAADIYGLEMDAFVQKLVTNKYYNIGNRYLPGNLSPFAAIRRAGANVYLEADPKGTFSIHRFFPTKPHPVCKTEEDYQKAIDDSYQILHKNLELITKKWNRPTISMSGGTDSRTTLACANGLYDRFTYFSFQSKDTEVADSIAAHQICEELGLAHKIHPIPADNAEIEDFEELKAIVVHSYGYVRQLADNEIRKHIYLYRLNDFDVEVKSWISEIVRVFFDRKYGMRMPDTLTPRHFSIFQTRYFLSPKLLRESDRIYAQYMQEFGLDKPIENYEHTDLYYWEVRMSSWGMMVTQSLDLCHRITFPFNNRKLMELMFSMPREKRKLDTAHEDIIRHANPKIYELGLATKNKYFLPYRIWLEKIYYYFRTVFYRR